MISGDDVRISNGFKVSITEGELDRNKKVKKILKMKEMLLVR